MCFSTQILVMIVGLVLVNLFADRLALSVTRCFQRRMPLVEIEPWLYEPVAPHELPAAHADYYAQHTRDFARAGFRLLGNFVMGRRPIVSTARFYLNEEGTILGNVECYLGTKGLSFVSLAEDGRYLETAVVSALPPVPAESLLTFTRARGTTVSEVLQEHVDVVTRYCRATGADLMPMAADDFRTVLDYGQRLSAQCLHQQGIVPELPEFMRRRHALGAAS
jgi:hypothetical protein